MVFDVSENCISEIIKFAEGGLKNGILKLLNASSLNKAKHNRGHGLKHLRLKLRYRIFDLGFILEQADVAKTRYSISLSYIYFSNLSKFIFV